MTTHAPIAALAAYAVLGGAVVAPMLVLVADRVPGWARDLVLSVARAVAFVAAAAALLIAMRGVAGVLS